MPSYQSPEDAFEVFFAGATYFIVTKKFGDGWAWYCEGFSWSDPVFPTRSEAADAALAAIRLDSKRSN